MADNMMMFRNLIEKKMKIKMIKNKKKKINQNDGKSGFNE